MVYSLTQRLQSLGVATQLGEELEAQITAGTGNSFALKESGFVPELADYVADGITSGSLNAVQINRYGIPAAVAVAIAKAVNAPRNTAVPTITGTAQVGQTLTRTTGTWAGSPTPTYTQIWTANGVTISGATGTTYVPVIGDIGKVIRVVVTATNPNGSASATSAPTAAVIAA